MLLKFFNVLVDQYRFIFPKKSFLITISIHKKLKLISVKQDT